MKWKNKCIISNDKYRKWHKWFAWYPVKITKDEVIWLEDIIRKQYGSRNYSFIERLRGKPSFEYKESMFDLLKINDDTEDRRGGC